MNEFIKKKKKITSPKADPKRNIELLLFKQQLLAAPLPSLHVGYIKFLKKAEN